MIMKTEKEQSANLKEEKAVATFRVTVRDRVHFYKIVNWLNENVGKGSDKWTMEGRPLRAIKSGRSPAIKVYIFKEGFDHESSLYLSLL